jgi:hypothetical protein
MRIIRLLLISVPLLHAAGTKAGEPIAWLSYGHSKYVSSPGSEAAWLFRDRVGINIGVGFYYQYPDHSRVTSITHDASFGFYCANVGLAAKLFTHQEHSAGLIAGFKLYYGPDYRKLRYYEEGGYNIWFDASALQPDYGPDIGAFYSFRKYSFLVKWDFARNRFRIGLGYRFR